MSALDDALATLADPTSTPASRLGAASIARFEIERLTLIEEAAHRHVNAYNGGGMSGVLRTFKGLLAALGGPR